MTTLISKLSGPHSPAEADDDVPETSPIPMAVVGLAVLLFTDIAATLATIAALG